MTPAVKLISVLAIMQALTVAVGYLLTVAVFDPADFFGDASPRHWPWSIYFAGFMRFSGAWFLVVPGIWLIVASLRLRCSARRYSAHDPVQVAGVVLTIVLFALFVVAIAASWYTSTANFPNDT